MSRDPFHVTAGSAPVRAMGEHQFRFLASHGQTGGSYSLMEVVSPEGSGPGPHQHEEAEEHFVVLVGEVDFEVGGRTFSAKPGDFVHVPRRTIHRFTVTSSTATMIATFSPAGEEQAFIDASVPITAEHQAP